MQDDQLIDKLAQQTRERIPGRAVRGKRRCARGAPAAECDLRGFAL